MCVWIFSIQSTVFIAVVDKPVCASVCVLGRVFLCVRDQGGGQYKMNFCSNI